MFTGLIQHIGAVRLLSETPGGEARLSVDLGPLAEGSRPGDSIAIDGCCLTIVSLEGASAFFDVVPETLAHTTLGGLQAGSRVNLERALLPSSPLGGHFVQGHIDGLAAVSDTREGGRWAEWHFKLEDARLTEQIVEKGSIALDGISLTVADCDARAGTFWVALIPETLARTTIAAKRKGARVNVETDILGKYVVAALKLRGGEGKAPGRIDEAFLRDHGYGR